MTLDIDTLVKVLSFALSVGAMIFAFFANRRKDVDQRIEAVETKQSEADRKIDRIEARLETLPTHTDVHGLQLEVTRMNGQLQVLAEKLDGNAAIMSRLEVVVNRQEDHLIGN